MSPPESSESSASTASIPTSSKAHVHSPSAGNQSSPPLQLQPTTQKLQDVVEVDREQGDQDADEQENEKQKQK